MEEQRQRCDESRIVRQWNSGELSGNGTVTRGQVQKSKGKVQT